VVKNRTKKPRKDEKSDSTQHQTVLVDVSFPGFLISLESLDSVVQERVLTTIEKIQQMTWQDVYQTSSKTPGQKRGINFEPIDQRTRSGIRIATIRISQKIRARVCRREQFMIFISLHQDHDSAYKTKGGEDI